MNFPGSNGFDLFPLRHALHGYNTRALRGDLRASINVALLAFPQGMAYALIAGLPIQYGIYGSAVAAIAGALFARSRYITLGPTNATSVLLLSAFASLGLADAEKLRVIPLIVVMAGIFLIVAARLNVAHLIQYISRSVITGYVTAAAILIIANQLGNVLGFGLNEMAATFFDVARLTLARLGETEWPAVLAALITLGVYLVLCNRTPRLPNVAITIVIMSVVVLALPGRESLSFLSGVDATDWPITLPSVNFGDVNRLSSVALAIAVLSMLEGTSIGKSLAARAGDRLNTNQEVYAMGMANIGCGFLSAMPASGSLTRSVLNWSSGATGPLASLYAGLICAAGAFLVGPYIDSVPKPVLAVLVICIGVSLINRRQIRIVTRSTASDAAVFYTTLGAGLLFPLDVAIYLGAGMSIVLFMRKAAMPEMVEYGFGSDGQLTELQDGQSRADPEISIVHVEGNLFFGAAELFRDQLRRVCEDPNLKIIVLKLRNAHCLDATSVMALEELVQHVHKSDRALLISEVRDDTMRIFERSGLHKVLAREDVFPDDPANTTASTAAAMRRARDIIGGDTARVSIYAGGSGESAQ